jgi:murein DD-endopeptidase MepM/ murein hydrolase activator NlpD
VDALKGRTASVLGLIIGLLVVAVRQPSAQAGPLRQAPILSPAAITTPTPPPGSTPTAAGQPLVATPALTYTVQPGDTLFTVALEIGVDLDDMGCIVAPDFTPDQPLVIGNVLAIPPPGTLCHQVQRGETLTGLAARYGVPAAAMVALPWNRLVGQAPQLAPGRHLHIPLTLDAPAVRRDAPGGLASAEDFLSFMLHQPVNTSPFVVLAVGGPSRAVAPAPQQVPANWPYGSGHFSWPLHGWLTQGYRYDHRAVDIAAPAGTPVTAADRGVVIRAGWNDQGYGLFVIIDHNIDYVTLYAHLSELFVGEGQVVAQGQALGQVGSTGNSTGPHLHFEIRDFGRLTNPLELLGR